MITITDIFDKEKVEQVEKDFSKLELTPGSKGIITQSAQLLSQFLPLSVTAIKGNTWYVLKEWQMETKQTLAEAVTNNPDGLIDIVKVLFQRGKERTKKLLVNPEEQQELIDDAFDKAYDLYLSYAKKRDRKKKK